MSPPALVVGNISLSQDETECRATSDEFQFTAASRSISYQELLLCAELMDD